MKGPKGWGGVGWGWQGGWGGVWDVCEGGGGRVCAQGGWGEVWRGGGHMCMGMYAGWA